MGEPKETGENVKQWAVEGECLFGGDLPLTEMGKSVWSPRDGEKGPKMMGSDK